MAQTTLRKLEQQLRDVSHEASKWAERMAQPNPSSKTVAEYHASQRELARIRELIYEEQLRKKWADEAPDFGAKLREDVLYTPEGQSRTAGTYIHLDFSPKSDRVVSRSGTATIISQKRTLAKNQVAGSGPELAIDGSVASWLYQGMLEVSGVLRASPEILRTGTGNRLGVPTITDIGAVPNGEPIAERGPIPKAEPTFGQVDTEAFGYKQGLTISRELVQDNVVDLNRFVGRNLGRLLGRYLGRDLVLGSGTAQPLGVHSAIPSPNKVQAVAGSAGIPSSTTAKADFDKLYEIISKVPSDLRVGGHWVLHPDSVLTLRRAKATNGLVIWPADQELLAGYPYVTDSRLTPIGVGAADGTCTVVFFNPAAYLVRLVKQVRVEWTVLSHDAFESDQVAVRAILRADGRPLDVNALAGLSRNTS